MDRDFASLHQHPADGERTAAETELFKQGLGGLGSMYAHKYTTVFRLTRPPADYPAAYDLPEGSNTGAYRDRGWCFTESCWSSMTKSSDRSLDLGKLDGSETTKYQIMDKCTQGGGRLPPITPEGFAAAVQDKTFTNGKDDKPLVTELYRKEFAKQFGKAEVLVYKGLGWGDAEAVQDASRSATHYHARIAVVTDDWFHGGTSDAVHDAFLGVRGACFAASSFPLLGGDHLAGRHVDIHGFVFALTNTYTLAIRRSVSSLLARSLLRSVSRDGVG